MDKILSLLARPSDGPADDTPWYLKYGGRVLGIVGAFFAILFGLWNCVSILLANVSCLVSGILQMMAGFVVMALEAPFCCMFIDHVQTLAGKVDTKPVYMKGALYCAIAIPPVILCPGLGSIFGCGLIFATGVIYGMIGLGKKAPADEMRRAAAAQQQQQTPSNPKSFFSSSSNDTASIANNVSPIGKTNPPAKSPFDSNV